MKRFTALIFALTISAAVFAQSEFYEGDGGKGLSIEVIQPKITGRVTDENSWFPDFAANMIHDDMEKYSAITMIDGTNMDAQMEIDDRNMNSGLFEGAGEISYKAAENTLFINLTVTPTDYNLSVRVNQSNETKASHNKNYSVADMNSGYAIKNATADILGQLGVKLTAKGKESLLSVEAAKNSVEAQKLYAKGSEALQKGSKVEALSYFIQANTNDADLGRAIEAMSQTSTSVAAGDIGSKARNAIQQRKDFLKLITDIKENFEKNPPYILVFDPNLDIGKIDYEKETVGVNVKVAIIEDFEKLRMCNNVLAAIKNAPDSEHWNIKEESILDFKNAFFGLTITLSHKNGEIVDKFVWGNETLRMQYGYTGYNTRILSMIIPAETDTSDLVLSFSDIMHSTHHAWLASSNGDARHIEISKLTKDDYYNKVLKKSFRKVESAAYPGIFLVSFPNGSGNVGIFMENFYSRSNVDWYKLAMESVSVPEGATIWHDHYNSYSKYDGIPVNELAEGLSDWWVERIIIDERELLKHAAEKERELREPSLRIGTAMLGENYRKELKLGGKQDLMMVWSLKFGSTAMTGGMQPGDIIVSFNGKDIKKDSDLIIESLSVGDIATVKVKRGSSNLDLKIRIGSKFDNDKLIDFPGFLVCPSYKDFREKFKVPSKIKGVFVNSPSTMVKTSPFFADLSSKKAVIITSVSGKKVNNVTEFYNALNDCDKSDVWFDVYSCDEKSSFTTRHYNYVSGSGTGQ